MSDALKASCLNSSLITHHLLSCRGRLRRSAVAVEGFGEFVRDLLGKLVLDLVAFEHEDELAVFEERDLRRGWRVRREVLARGRRRVDVSAREEDRKSTRLNSSHVSISYAVFCL